MKADRKGCKDVRGFGAEATIIQDLGGENRPDVDSFPDITPGFKDSGVAVEHSQSAQGKWESCLDEISDGQPERELQETDNANGETEKPVASAPAPDSEAV